MFSSFFGIYSVLIMIFNIVVTVIVISVFIKVFSGLFNFGKITRSTSDNSNIDHTKAKANRYNYFGKKKKYCYHCGNFIEDYELKCPNCGKKNKNYHG